MVHRLGIVHLVDVTHGLHGEEDKLAVGIAAFRLQGDELAQGTGLECLVFSYHLGKLVGGIGLGIEHLGSDATVVFAHEVQDGGCLAGLIAAETLGTEVPGVVEEILGRSKWRS